MARAAVLTEAEINKVLKIIGVGRNRERNRIAFLLSAWAGMRVGEIAALKLKDVLNPDLSVVQQVNLKAAQTKGSKGRVVVLNDKMRKELCAYLKTRRLSDLSAPVIASQRTGKHFSNTTLCMQFSSFYKQAGMRNTSHAGRRTFATKLNAQGVGMRTIQLLMGHQHIATTALYCDVTDEQLYRAANLA